jgi:DNA-directed RNA polymerase subunit H (RpoH/RPB5)
MATASNSQTYLLFQYIFKSRKHILEMLQDRGYNIDDYMNYTMDEIKSMVQANQLNKYESNGDKGPLDIHIKKKSGESIFVKYRLEDRFKKTENLNNQINEVYNNYLKKEDTLIVLNISRIIIKPGVKDKTDEEYVKSLYLTKGYFVQFFGLENFLFNVSKHQFVPKHTVLNKAETLEMMKQFNIKNIKNLPVIKRFDAQAKYIGLRPRQVCRIDYANHTTGVGVKYRICLN